MSAALDRTLLQYPNMSIAERTAFIFGWNAAINIKEAGRTVRSKRPVQQRKVAIWPCTSDVKCDNRGPEHNCNYHGSCSGRGHTATFA